MSGYQWRGTRRCAYATPDQLTVIERYWHSRSALVCLYGRDRGLINATTDVLALVEALRQSVV
jgi:hypothetical protein